MAPMACACSARPSRWRSWAGHAAPPRHRRLQVPAPPAGGGRGVAGLRKDYGQASLNEDECRRRPDPAVHALVRAGAEGRGQRAERDERGDRRRRGRPSSRIVLVKQFDERGFTWYTNYDSQKGRNCAPIRMQLCYSFGANLNARCGSKAGRAHLGRRKRQILPQPAVEEPAVGDRVPAERADRQPRGLEHQLRGVARQRRDAGSGRKLGRLPPGAGTDRVLAGAAFAFP
jgi:hypothetical protein